MAAPDSPPAMPEQPATTEEHREGDVDHDDEEDGEIAESPTVRRPPPSTREAPPSKPPVTAPSKGAYIPPAKRKLMLQQAQEEANSDSNEAQILRQRESWNSQRRVIHGTVNRLNATTIKPLIQELFQQVNLIRMRGVLCKSVMVAAMSSPKYADVFAALIAVINSKLPEVGELMVSRSVLAFRRYYQHREKASCQAVCLFLAHLFHQAVVHELLILQILSVLLDGEPTDDSVEVAVELLQTTGQALLEVSPTGVRACLERLRALLHEGQLNKRVEYKMEKLLKQRRTGFKDFPSLQDDLDLVERDDQITHEISLDDQDLQKEDELDSFRVNPDFEETEAEWKTIQEEVLGGGDSSDDDDDDSEDSDDSSSESDDDDNDDIPDQELKESAPENKKLVQVIQDLTEQDLVHLRRTIYLTIMSSATFEECTHKLAKIDIPPGREMELINMLIECCSQERTFLRYYGLIAARFCLLDDRWKNAFVESFKEQYSTIHRLETNKLRNVAKLFAHVLHTDSIPWSVMECIHLNEDETTSSSRIFIKIVVQEIAEAIGIAKLKGRFESNDEEARMWYGGMFPKDNIRNTRYAINFFTSIGLGPLTDDLREFLKNAPKLIMAKAKEAALAKAAADSDASSVVTSSSSSSSSTGSYSSSSSYSSSYSSSSSRSYSSSSSGSSYSGRRRGRRSRRRSRSDSQDSEESESSRSRGKRRERNPKSHRSRSSSPPKEIVKKAAEASSEAAENSKRSTNKKSRSRDKRSVSPSPQERRKKRRNRSPSSDDESVDSRKVKKDSRRSNKRSRRRGSSNSDEQSKNSYRKGKVERERHDSP
eukprot:Nitzschia sp. Nitz4//scaffold81_size91200//293//2764//NITZ4_004972-RA/size91200-processed-gene-0.116-mRNA-1//-1//CDS//3329558668//3929//frame0